MAGELPPLLMSTYTYLNSVIANEQIQSQNIHRQLSSGTNIFDLSLYVCLYFVRDSSEFSGEIASTSPSP